MKDEDYNIRPDQYYVNTVSSMDCTGLIPAGMVKEDELNAYKELYSFGQPVLPDEKENDSRTSVDR